MAFIRWSRLGVFNRTVTALTDRGKPERSLIETSNLKAQHSAAGLLTRLRTGDEFKPDATAVLMYSSKAYTSQQPSISLFDLMRSSINIEALICLNYRAIAP